MRGATKDLSVTPIAHVIPHWIYSDGLGDDKHDRRVVRIDISNDNINPNLQAIKKAKFLCNECEGLTAKLDRAASHILKSDFVKSGKVIQTTTKELTGRYVCFENVDGLAIWKFVVSMILREFYFPRYSKWEKSQLELRKYEEVFKSSLTSDDYSVLEQMPLICFGSNGKSTEHFATIYPMNIRFEKALAISVQSGYFSFLLFPNSKVELPFPMNYRVDKSKLHIILADPMSKPFFPEYLEEMLRRKETSVV